MRADTFTFRDAEGYDIFVYRWFPDPGGPEKAVLLLAHGMAEHAGRYAGLADSLTNSGYLVYAPDHRGHGRTGKIAGAPGYLGANGIDGVVNDLRQLRQMIRQNHPDLPVFLLGHSMGSFLAQKYMYLDGSDVAGVILSGTSGPLGPVLIMGRILAKLVMLLKGPKASSPLLHHLSFVGYNSRIRPCRTEYDWLSRDAAAVERYISDPLCGNVLSAAFYYELYRALHDIHQSKNQLHIPRNLPLFIISGTEDPVGSYTRTVRQLIVRYQKLGIADLNYRFYPGGRHEMINELNGAEVSRDIIAWLDKHCSVSK